MVNGELYRCHETWVNDGKLVGGLEHFLFFHIYWE